MVKYGTFVMYQNKTTDEVIEVALADEEELRKYAEDPDWREVGNTDDHTDSEDNKEE
jgi:hypothetical protein